MVPVNAMVKPIPTMNTSRALISSLECRYLATASTALSVRGCQVGWEGVVFGAYTVGACAVCTTCEGDKGGANQQ